MSEVLFVDTETLGLDADAQPIWELAWIEPNGRMENLTIRRSPREFDLAHPVALEMMGDRYVQAEVRDQLVDEAWAINLFSTRAKGCHLAGAVVSFDEERLRRMAWKHSVPVTWHYHLIDVEALAVGFLCGRDASGAWARGLPWKSEDLSREVGVNPDEFDKHTALGDALWAKAIYDAVAA